MDKENMVNISTKDLSYLSDMFEWNMTSFKNINSILPNIQDTDILNIFKKINENLISNMEQIIDILKGCLNETN